MKRKYMYLRDFVIQSYKEDQLYKFGYSAGCIESLYFSCLPKKVDTTPFSKIIIEAVEIGTEYSLKKKKIENMINVVLIRDEMNFETYFKLNDNDKKRAILEFIQKCTNELADTFKWDKKPFQGAYECVIAKDYTHKNFLKQPLVYSPDKKLKAQIFFDFQVDKIDIYIAVRDKKGNELQKKYITAVKPRDFWLMQIAGELSWIDRTITLISQDKKEKWIMNIN